ncbi:hypothetical protein [Bacillus sp. FJAT-44742]|uniref:hypothetical protein n=1 Tax=Bacillus sp. FJAT-44742 TaxID=2014005 RepID=UPI0012FED3D5|nr:hypothetical protein [Bacillus sp. FJAT-44742]
MDRSSIKYLTPREKATIQDLNRKLQNASSGEEKEEFEFLIAAIMKAGLDRMKEDK